MLNSLSQNDRFKRTHSVPRRNVSDQSQKSFAEDLSKFKMPVLSKDTNDVKKEATGEDLGDKSDYASNNFWRMPD